MQAPESAAIYLLNEKRVELRRLEDENNCNIFILPDKDMHPSDCQISTLKGAARGENSYSLSAKTAGDKAEKWRNRLTAEHHTAQPLVKTRHAGGASAGRWFGRKTQAFMEQMADTEGDGREKNFTAVRR